MQPNQPDGATPIITSPKETVIAPLCKPTSFSKYFALALFVALPFVGGVVGYVTAMSQTEKNSPVLVSEKVPMHTSVQVIEMNTSPDTLPQGEASTNDTSPREALAVTIASIDAWLFSFVKPNGGTSVSEVRQTLLSADIEIPESLWFASREYEALETRVNLIPNPYTYFGDTKLTLTGMAKLSFNHMFGAWTVHFVPDAETAALLPKLDHKESSYYIVHNQELVDALCKGACTTDTDAVTTQQISLEPEEVSVLIHNIGTEGVGNMLTIKTFTLTSN